MANNGVFYSGGTGGTGLDLTSGGVTRINVSTGGVITFNNDYSFPIADGGVNEVLITNGSGNVSFNTIPNASLDNSSITIAGSVVSLGGSITADSIIGQVSAGEILLTQLEEDSITINGTSVALGGSINVGDITNVGAGNGLTGGGSSGSVTLDVGAGTGISVDANTVGLDYLGTNNFIDSATNLEGTGIALGDTIVYHDATDNNVKKGFVSDLPFTNTSGTVTNVTVGTGLDVTNGTTTPNITLDLSELPTSTTNVDGDYFVVVDTSNVQRKLTKANINISGFNNDAGYITSAGNTNIYSTDGSLTGNRFLNQNGRILEFESVGEEYFQVYNNNNIAIRVPRVRMEADDPYTTVLELQSSNPDVFLIDGYDSGNSQIFNVDGNGNLFATSKSFLIEHPSKPEFNLRHGSLEGPEHGVYVRGKLDGNNVIELPDYWIDLVDESTITVQLTPIGSHQNLYVKDIFENMVVVNNSALLSSKIKCFYFIQAERKDIDKMVVEYPKGTQSI